MNSPLVSSLHDGKYESIIQLLDGALSRLVNKYTTKKGLISRSVAHQKKICRKNVAENTKHRCLRIMFIFVQLNDQFLLALISMILLGSFGASPRSTGATSVGTRSNASSKSLLSGLAVMACLIRATPLSSAN
jgi:hypothetical protein